MNIQPCVFIVDDDPAVRDALGLVMETACLAYQTFESAEHFLQTYCLGKHGCMLLDVNLPGLSGHELQAELSRRNIHLPIIFLTAYGDIPMTVRAIKAGAVDFLTKPVPSKLLIKHIRDALQYEDQMQEQAMTEQVLCNRLSGLTSRELEILQLVIEGQGNKEIARHLNISHRTVEAHRSRIITKTGATSFLELARMCEVCKLYQT